MALSTKSLLDVFAAEDAKSTEALPSLGKIRRPKRMTKREFAEMAAVAKRLEQLLREAETDKATGNPYNRLQSRLLELSEWSRHLGSQAAVLAKVADRQLDLLSD